MENHSDRRRDYNFGGLFSCFGDEVTGVCGSLWIAFDADGCYHLCRFLFLQGIKIDSAMCFTFRLSVQRGCGLVLVSELTYLFGACLFSWNRNIFPWSPGVVFTGYILYHF